MIRVTLLKECDGVEKDDGDDEEHRRTSGSSLNLEVLWRQGEWEDENEEYDVEEDEDDNM